MRSIKCHLLRGAFRSAPAIALTLLGSPWNAEADTRLFENLAIFGTRLDTGDPSVDRRDPYGRALTGPKAIEAADLNGDPFPDLAVANKDGTVTVFFGNGDASFGIPYHLDTGASELRGVVCADLTGNGRCDIAVGAPFDGKVVLFFNNGSGTFAPASSLDAWVGARDLAAGDFDGDGLMDLAVAGSTNGVAQFRSLGGGAFEWRTNITAMATLDNRDLPQPAFYLKAFRYPGETRDELAVARAQKQNVWVLGADLTGTLAINGVLTNVSVNALDVGPLLRPATNSAPDLVIAHNDRGLIEIHPADGPVSPRSEHQRHVGRNGRGEW